MRAECYGATRAKDEGGPNEDAFWIGRAGKAVAALCDGAGHASQCAPQVLRRFERRVTDGMLDLASFPSWTGWLRSEDASLAGGPQTTFVGIGLVDDRLVGACAGDSRAYLVTENGSRLLTATRTPRLGSGNVVPSPIHETVAPHDVVLLMSDGAWGPLANATHRVRQAVADHALKHLADLAPAILDLAGANGRPDDMTVVALRILR